jgi:sugar O-acyltransferase (sialic acid O-acetyltransferase NeuD family)
MNVRYIYPLGASNPEIIRLIRAIQIAFPRVVFPGFLDNDPQKHGKMLGDYQILGGRSLIPSLAGDDVGFVSLVTGTTKSRYETGLDILNNGGKLVSLIHPNVDLFMTQIGDGCYIQESVVIQAEVEVGFNSSIHMGALIGHESRVGQHVFIAHGACISGSCTIGDGVFIGANATILPRLKIGKWAVVGAGSVVTKDVAPYSIVAGNPAKVIKVIKQTDWGE